MNEQMTTYVEPKDKTYRDSLRVPALSIKENRGFLFIFPPFFGAFLIGFPVNIVYSTLLPFLDLSFLFSSYYSSAVLTCAFWVSVSFYLHLALLATCQQSYLWAHLS